MSDSCGLPGTANLAGCTSVRALPLTYRKTKLLSLSVISSPSLLAQLPVEQPADVMRHRLITAATRPGQWEAWLDSVDVDHQLMEGGHRFDHLFVAMHAVRDGLGSIMAPVKLFEASFAKQELAAPLAHVAIKGVPYFVHRTPRAEGKHVTLFTNWLHRAAS